MPGCRREVESLDRVVLLGPVVILIAIIAGQFAGVAPIGERMAAGLELDQIQKALSSYMLSTGTQRVDPAVCVSDFDASTPVLWPDCLDKRYSTRSQSYGCEEEGTVVACGATAVRPGSILQRARADMGPGSSVV